jgi:hypothetical protein
MPSYNYYKYRSPYFLPKEVYIMPWTRRKSRKLATQVGMVLGYIASIPINITSNWLQIYILPNPLYFVTAIILSIAALYWVRKKQASFLASASITFAVSIFLNLLSSWVQEKVLHNTFTFGGVLLIISIPIFILVLSNFIASHPVSRFENRMWRRHRRLARVIMAAEGEKRYVRKQPKKTMKRRKR